MVAPLRPLPVTETLRRLVGVALVWQLLSCRKSQCPAPVAAGWVGQVWQEDAPL